MSKKLDLKNIQKFYQESPIREIIEQRARESLSLSEKERKKITDELVYGKKDGE